MEFARQETEIRKLVRLNRPLAVLPSVIAFRINVKEMLGEIQFGRSIATVRVEVDEKPSMFPCVKILRVITNHFFDPAKLSLRLVLHVSQNSPSKAPNIVLEGIETQCMCTEFQCSLREFVPLANGPKIIEDFVICKKMSNTIPMSSWLNLRNLGWHSHSSLYRMLTTGTESSWGSSLTSLHSLLYRYICFNQCLLTNWIFKVSRSSHWHNSIDVCESINRAREKFLGNQTRVPSRSKVFYSPNGESNWSAKLKRWIIILPIMSFPTIPLSKWASSNRTKALIKVISHRHKQLSSHVQERETNLFWMKRGRMFFVAINIPVSTFWCWGEPSQMESSDARDKKSYNRRALTSALSSANASSVYYLSAVCCFFQSAFMFFTLFPRFPSIPLISSFINNTNKLFCFTLVAAAFALFEAASSEKKKKKKAKSQDLEKRKRRRKR